jgi:glutaredoxin-like protein NrdH
MPKVTVYTLPVCPQCDRTKKLLAREGIAYETVDLTQEPELAAEFKAAGLLQAPIVVVGNDGRRWSGFRPDLIKELADASVAK